MKAECFNTSRDHFDILDLRAQFHFKGASSIGFDLGPIPKGQVLNIVSGALQVHHPCTGHIQAHVYVQLPRRFSDPQLLRQLCDAVFRELGIPDDETYELHYSGSEGRVQVDQRVSKEGLVDAI
jgi:hypothetical protein